MVTQVTRVNHGNAGNPVGPGSVRGQTGQKDESAVMTRFQVLEAQDQL